MFKVVCTYKEDDIQIRAIVTEQDTVRLIQSSDYKEVKAEPTTIPVPTDYYCDICQHLQPLSDPTDRLRHRITDLYSCDIAKQENVYKLLLSMCNDFVDMAAFCSMPAESLISFVSARYDGEGKPSPFDFDADESEPIKAVKKRETQSTKPIIEGDTIRLFPAAPTSTVNINTEAENSRNATVDIGGCAR